ncbi:hypothetical protein ACP275_05G030200 [Erythranthe tilingii]
MLLLIQIPYFSFTIFLHTMVMKIPLLLSPFLWFFLILIFFHQFHIFEYLQNSSTVVNAASSSTLGHRRRQVPLIAGHRKILAGKFDFTPFLNRHRHRKLRPPGGREIIDPLYGVEKRLVPTGPNPLHH